ncbi:MAG: hypothetical protein ACRDHZ_10690 [Ktedonobacteraceae bacterium]
MRSEDSRHSRREESKSTSGSPSSQHQKFIASENEQAQQANSIPVASWAILIILIIIVGTILLVTETFVRGNNSLQASAIQCAEIVVPSIIGFATVIYLKKPPTDS